MPFTFQPFMQQPYQPRNTEAIATQIGVPGNAQAAAELRKGQAAEQATQGISHSIDSTLNNLIAVKQRNADPGYQLEKLKLQGAQEAQKDDDLMRQAMAAAGGDPEKALAALRSQGSIGVNAAGKLEDQVNKSRRALVDDQKNKLSVAEQQLKMVTQILPEPPKAPDPQDELAAQTYQTDQHIFAQKYKAAIPQLQQIMGDHAQGLPDPNDPDLVKKIGAMREQGMTIAEKTGQERLTLELAQKAIDARKDSREADKYWAQAASTTLPLATSQQEWDEKLHGLATAGAPATTLARFGATFSPEAAKAAQDMGRTPDQVAKSDEGPKLGSLEDYMATYSRDVLKRPASTMTAGEKSRAAQAWAQAHHVEGSSGKLAPKDLTEMLDAVEKHPSIFQAITPDLRGQLIGPLNARGFTQFEKTESPATKAANKKWAIAESNRIDKAVAYREMTADEAIRAKAAIREVVGDTGDTSDPAAPPAPPAAPAPVKQPALSPAQQGMIGQVGMVKGKKVRITGFDENGRPKGVEVP